MSKEEVVELVEEYRPSSVRGVKVERESKHLLCISFFIQKYDRSWHRVKEYNILKAAIKPM